MNNNQNNTYFINLPKKNIINNNIFNKAFNSPTIKNNNNYDSDSSSLNNESIIIDNIEYLNDEDIIPMPEHKMKKNYKNIYNKSDIYKKFMNGKIDKIENKYNNIDSYKNIKRRNDNYSLRSNNTTKVSTLNNSKQTIEYINKDIKINSLNPKKFKKVFYNFNLSPLKLSYLNNKEIVTNTPRNNHKYLINKELFNEKSLEKDNKKIINDGLSVKNINYKNIIYNNVRDKRRINKRKVNIKKIKINLM
jgi:hypothetical protein